jgi:hypothetical protein
VGLREAGCRGVVSKTDVDDNNNNNEAQSWELLKILTLALL